MTKTIFCKRLQKEAEPLSKAPFPGELGEKILQNISKQAWNEWLNHQTMLINEYRLSMIDPKARNFLKEEMQKYLFDGADEKPQGYTPEDE
jgi:Fe-S cluster biosynthesis and repair protein YggX